MRKALTAIALAATLALPAMAHIKDKDVNQSKEAVKDTYQDSKEAVDHAADRAADKAEAIGDAAKNG